MNDTWFNKLKDYDDTNTVNVWNPNVWISNSAKIWTQASQISDIQDFWDTDRTFKIQRVRISDSVWNLNIQMCTIVF